MYGIVHRKHYKTVIGDPVNQLNAFGDEEKNKLVHPGSLYINGLAGN